MKKFLQLASVIALIAVVAGGVVMAQTVSVERETNLSFQLATETTMSDPAEQTEFVIEEADAPPESKAMLVGLGPNTSAVDITADGEVVIGGFLFGNCFKWTAAGGVEPLEGFEECRVNSDGSIITGALFDIVNGREREVMGISDAGYNWRVLEVPADWTGCDFSAANMYDVSGDGATVVGLGWPTCKARGVEWTEETGFVILDDSLLDPTGVQQTRADAANEDGSVIAGWQTAPFGTRWGAKWVDGVAEWILTEDGEHVGEANGVSRWGDYVVGAGLFDLEKNRAWMQNPDGSITWMGNNLNDLGRPPTPQRQFATAVTPDGETVIGFSQDSNTGERFAWIWQGGSTKNLDQVLFSAGAKNVRTDWQSLQVARGISDDGKVIVGFGINADGFLEGFVATLP
jgi:uncharacterized membrane protein